MFKRLVFMEVLDMELIIGSHVSYKSDTQLLGSVKEALKYGEIGKEKWNTVLQIRQAGLLIKLQI